jgi:hypothetical protein
MPGSVPMSEVGEQIDKCSHVSKGYLLRIDANLGAANSKISLNPL